MCGTNVGRVSLNGMLSLLLLLLLLLLETVVILVVMVAGLRLVSMIVVLLLVLVMILLLLVLMTTLLLRLLVAAFRCSLKILPFFGSPILYPDVGLFIDGQPIAPFLLREYGAHPSQAGIWRQQPPHENPATSHRVSLSTASSSSPSLALTLSHESP